MKLLNKKLITLLLTVVMLLTAGCSNKVQNEMLNETQSVETQSTEEESSTLESDWAEIANIDLEDDVAVKDITESETEIDSDGNVEVNKVLSSGVECGVLFNYCDNIKYSTDNLNIRIEPNSQGTRIGTVIGGEEVKEIGVGENGWSKIEYDDKIGYVESSCLADEKPAMPVTVSETSYPLSYEDDTCKITIYREWFENAWCYAAHLEFTDYSRFGTACGNDRYGGYEQPSHGAQRIGAIFAVNGCNSVPSFGYEVVRDGVIYNGADKELYLPGIYSKGNGLFSTQYPATGEEFKNKTLGELVDAGLLTDTFCFGPPFLVDGVIPESEEMERAQRTFIGSNGNPGDLWIVVSDGRYNDGESSGLTGVQCARYLQSKGCISGIPLSGGHSSIMIFQGKLLNANKANESPLVDFVYFK